MTFPLADNLCHVGMPPAQVIELGNQAASRLVAQAVTALNTVGAGTITAAGIVGRITARGGAQSATPYTDTTDTAAAIIAAQSNIATGTSWVYIYQNNTNAAATVTGGTGVTVTGVTTVPANAWAEYLVSMTGAATVTMVGVEMGANAALPDAKFTTINVTTGTLAAGNASGAKFVCLMSTNATPGSQAMRTPAQILADMPNGQVGMSYMLRITNTGAGTFTLATDSGAGFTMTGTMTVAQNTFRDFVVTMNSATTGTVQSVATGTYS